MLIPQQFTTYIHCILTSYFILYSLYILYRHTKDTRRRIFGGSPSSDDDDKVKKVKEEEKNGEVAKYVNIVKPEPVLSITTPSY